MTKRLLKLVEVADYDVVPCVPNVDHDLFSRNLMFICWSWCRCCSQQSYCQRTLWCVCTLLMMTLFESTILLVDFLELDISSNLMFTLLSIICWCCCLLSFWFGCSLVLMCILVINLMWMSSFVVTCLMSLCLLVSLLFIMFCCCCCCTSWCIRQNFATLDARLTPQSCRLMHCFSPTDVFFAASFVVANPCLLVIHFAAHVLWMIPQRILSSAVSLLSLLFMLILMKMAKSRSKSRSTRKIFAMTVSHRLQSKHAKDVMDACAGRIC